MPEPAGERRRRILLLATCLALSPAGPAALAEPPRDPVQAPEPAPGGWAAPFVDLSGRWRFADEGEVLDFALVPDTAEFTASGPDQRARMVTLPDGRVRLEIVIDGRTVITEGDLVVDGPPGEESHKILFDPLPGEARGRRLDRL